MRAKGASKCVLLVLGNILATESKPCFTVEVRKAPLGKVIYPRLHGIELFSVEHRGENSFVGNGISDVKYQVLSKGPNGTMHHVVELDFFFFLILSLFTFHSRNVKILTLPSGVSHGGLCISKQTCLAQAGV